MKSSPFDYRKLSVDERIQLVFDIWDSIAEDAGSLAPTDSQWREIERRLAAHRTNPDAAIPWEVVERQLDADEAESVPVPDCHKQELDRRIDEHQRNPDDVLPWEDVRATLRKSSLE
ncbi:MAG: addiction module protein [Planctomycetes bacterium]|nr:addiction module protein [Planctomycetota bacterium]